MDNHVMWSPSDGTKESQVGEWFTLKGVLVRDHSPRENIDLQFREKPLKCLVEHPLNKKVTCELDRGHGGGKGRREVQHHGVWQETESDLWWTGGVRGWGVK